MGSLILLPALGALFGAIVVGILAFGLGSRRQGVANALAAIDQTYASESVTLAPAELPLVERLGLLTRRFARLGHALTPAGAIGRLERRLELAGSPAAWPVERVVQAKGVLLIALGIW